MPENIKPVLPYIHLRYKSINNPDRHIAIICNPRSGKGKSVRLLPALENTLRNKRISFQSFADGLPGTLNTFTDLIIMGGDGTINFTINHFKEISIPVGIIRCGTGNDFSDLLLGKQPVVKQFETALFAEPRPVDAGTCNGRLFLNGVGIGFDGWIVKRLLAKGFFTGKAAYYSTVISLLLFYRESHITLTLDGKAQSTDLFMLSAANAQTYGGGFKVAPFADVRDGLLESILVQKVSLLKRLRYLPVIEKGKHLDQKLPFIQYNRVKEMTVTSAQPLHAHLDGEHMLSNTFEIKILPQKYKIRF